MPPQHPPIRISLSHTSRYDTTQPQYPRSKHASSLCTRLVTSLTFRRTHSINELLVLMLTLKNYERSANSRLRPLREHIFFSRDPMLPRLNLATLHQLLAPIPKANSHTSIPSWNQKRTLNLIDLEITHPCVHDHTGSLRDLLQSHLLLPMHN